MCVSVCMNIHKSSYKKCLLQEGIEKQPTDNTSIKDTSVCEVGITELYTSTLAEDRTN